ncbi:Xanthine/uracil permease [Favolaschia claudopus]|uniref:Xanthine/uracil permease n=1 Tax=Favolaschia claudopus TaxID=2862362 RepID=A0AAW0E362_9AGAR
MQIDQHHSAPENTSSSQAHRGVSIDGIIRKVTTYEGWFGGYDYGWLCMPSLRLPWSTRRASSSSHEPPFYALDAELPLLLAIANGLQHALAMVVGLITPPIILASALNLDSSMSSYMISASLIGCGIMSLVQISRIPLFGGYYLGSGLISVVGTGFSTLSTGKAIFDAMYADGACSSTTHADGSITRNACPEAYGKLLGTSLVCSFLEMFLAFVPARILKRTFPPIASGTVIVLIGAALIRDSGALNWGGGSNGCQDFPTSGIFQLCPTILAPRRLPWGSPELIGLGFLSFVSIILTELFGSPFLKNISVLVGLAVGCVVAGSAGYIDGSSIKTAPAITFLWVHTFKIGVHGPAILPMLAVYTSLTMETIGNIMATAEVSNVAVVGPEFDSRIQGGVLSDGLGGFISALFTVTPLSIFSQNNGVIAITRCANRAAGRWCCVFLVLFGILGKIPGALLAIPNPVLGGVTTFLFATVVISGLRVLAFVQYTRRDRFVLAAAMSFGLGNLLVPQLFTHLFDGVSHPNSAVQGLFNSITIILSAPFLSAGIVAVFLNLILPLDSEHVQSSE